MYANDIRHALEREIRTEEFQVVYEKIRGQNAFLGRFPLPEDLLGFMHDRSNVELEAKDEVFRTLLREYQGSGGEVLGAYLLVLLQPALGQLYYEHLRKLAGFPWVTARELESEIWAAGLAAAKAIDTQKRSRKIAIGIKNKVKSAVRKWFRGLSRQFREAPLEDAENLPQAQGPESPYEPEAMLNKLVLEGIVSQTEAFLILSTRVYGRKLTQIAAQLGGASYGALQRKKHRAEVRLKAHLARRVRGDV